MNIGKIKKMMPLILTIISSVGVVSTAVLTGRASIKASKKLEEAEEEKGEELTTIEVVKVSAPFYISAGVVGLATIACGIGSNVISTHNQARLLGAYALLDQSYKKYIVASKKVYGDDADINIKLAMTDDEVNVYVDGMTIYETDYEESDTLFYDLLSGRYFNSTFARVTNALYHTNRNLVVRGDVLVNEYHEFLGLEKVNDDHQGWNDAAFEYGAIFPWLDFEIKKTILEDGMECYLINCMWPPVDIVEYEPDID